MKSHSFRILLVLFSAVLFIQSCSNDDTTVVDEDPTENPAIASETTALIVEWNSLFLELDRYAFGMRPNATARALAYIHLAAYETAVADMDVYRSNNSRLPGFTINQELRAADVDLNLALNTCYALVLDHFIYNVQVDIDTKIEELQSTKEDELSTSLSTAEISNSIAWGTYVADRIITYSQTDVEAEAQILDPQPLSYEPPTGKGFWTFSADAERAWFPYWKSVRTFTISAEETSTVVPPLSYSEDTDSAYYAAMYEVYEINNAAREEDNEDLWIAEFWSDDVEGLMMSPPGRQISIANQLIEQLDLDFDRALALLLKIGFSLNDAAVSTWADKYEYMVMRPSVYIQELIDPEFQTNLYRFIFWPNPSFPGYPSGHSTFASAAAGVFISEFGDAITFTDRSHEGRTEFRGTPRQFSTFSAMAEENAFSRVPLGVHLRMDCTEGLRLGYEISAAVNNYNILN